MSDWREVSLSIGGNFVVPLGVRDIKVERAVFSSREDEGQEYSFKFTVWAENEEEAEEKLIKFRETLAAAIKP